MQHGIAIHGAPVITIPPNEEMQAEGLQWRVADSKQSKETESVKCVGLRGYQYGHDPVSTAPHLGKAGAKYRTDAYGSVCL